jgi:hypothetical protein
MKVTDDEHVHDNKPLPELVDDIIKLNSVTSIGKLLLVVHMMVMIFLDICPQTMESFIVSKYERMQKSN